MSRILDISVALHPGVPTWPGSPGFALHRYKRLEAGDGCNNSRLDCDVHVGTHVDAPVHFVAGGDAVDSMPPEVLIGPAVVAGLPGVAAVTARDLDGLRLPGGVQRLLLRTSNSELWAAAVADFREDFVALTADAAQWLVDREVRLIGVDYLSVQRFGDGPAVHEILLRAGTVIVEGLDLSGAEPGEYELICLPIKLAGADGAPARAVLRQPAEGGRG